MEPIDFYIPDVHGRSDLLLKLVAFLQRHARMRAAAPRYTFLGDLIDRGPDSIGCVEIALRTVAAHPGSVLLPGNHELMLLDAVDTDGKSETSGTWALNGGLDTVESYVGRMDVKSFFPAMRQRYRHHVAAFRDAPLYVERGGLLAVHAGIDHGQEPSGQDAATLCWIRDPFLDHADPATIPVIHGHTIIGPRPEVTENRISIDTGAFDNGRLSACIVDPNSWEIAFAQASERGVCYIEPKRLDRGYGTLLDDPSRIFEARREQVPAPGSRTSAEA